MKAYRLLICALLLGGCSAPAPVALFMLKADAEQQAATGAKPIDSRLLVGLGPVHLPEYLNRLQLVREVGSHQYLLDEQHRWAEHLDQNIGRALAQQLAGLLGAEQIALHPWPPKPAVDYQIGIDILEFHQGPDGVNRLQAQWQIRHQEQIQLSKRFQCAMPSSAEAEDIVSAQSRCLGRLGLELDAGLRQLLDHD